MPLDALLDLVLVSLVEFDNLLKGHVLVKFVLLKVQLAEELL